LYGYDTFHIPELDQYKRTVNCDAQKEFDASTNVMDKILLALH